MAGWDIDPRTYAKAIGGAITGGLAVWYTALGDNVMTYQEWVGVAQAAFLGLAVVWSIPNTEKTSVSNPPVIKEL